MQPIGLLPAALTPPKMLIVTGDDPLCCGLFYQGTRREDNWCNPGFTLKAVSGHVSKSLTDRNKQLKTSALGSILGIFNCALNKK